MFSNSYLKSKKKLKKAERFTAFLPLSSFIISVSCFKASMEVFSDSFSLFVDAWVKTKRLISFKELGLNESYYNSSKSY